MMMRYTKKRVLARGDGGLGQTWMTRVGLADGVDGEGADGGDGDIVSFVGGEGGHGCRGRRSDERKLRVGWVTGWMN